MLYNQSIQGVQKTSVLNPAQNNGNNKNKDYVASPCTTFPCPAWLEIVLFCLRFKLKLLFYFHNSRLWIVPIKLPLEE